MVNRDKSADERFQYNVKIQHHEQQMDEFSHDFSSLSRTAFKNT